MRTCITCALLLRTWLAWLISYLTTIVLGTGLAVGSLLIVVAVVVAVWLWVAGLARWLAVATRSSRIGILLLTGLVIVFTTTIIGTRLADGLLFLGLIVLFLLATLAVNGFGRGHLYI